MKEHMRASEIDRHGRAFAGRRTTTFARAAAALVVAAATAALTGCGAPSLEDVCGILENEQCSTWSGKVECIEDGEKIESRVDAAGGCDGAFDEYKKCLTDEPSCDFTSLCSAERAALETCIGPL